MLKEALDKYYYIMTVNEHKRLGSKVICSDITYNSILYLDLIAYTPDCTPSKLAEILNVSKSAVTSKSAEMIRQGLIESVKSETVSKLNNMYTDDQIRDFCEILNKFTELYTGELENGFNQ